MKLSELFGLVLSALLLLGVWNGVSVAIVVSYVLFTIFGLLVLVATLGVSELKGEDLHKVKEQLNVYKLIVGYIVAAAWVYVLLNTGNISLLWYYGVYQLIVHTFLFKLLTRKEVN